MATNRAENATKVQANNGESAAVRTTRKRQGKAGQKHANSKYDRRGSRLMVVVWRSRRKIIFLVNVSSCFYS